ncbi:phosphoenolpyruvate synthase [Fibrella sp. HMF5335]|uniref:Phosphoenolpyruvate synthase n=1 Tax=Fibrella rubiginis TaxID=2817060 RepID=A0A939GE34_9BACT|nr:phosphoenolpyruvate synthase [Fibrella rubiginis]MBO0935810.1 phosphoenolpyruvate synthase [Fibrella rubiginis]
MDPFVLPFHQITNQMVRQVGGKNASLGEMVSALDEQGVQVPDGFALTTAAYRAFLQENQLEAPLRQLLANLNTTTYANLAETGTAIRALFGQASLPAAVATAIKKAFRALRKQSSKAIQVAVRSSATAEDLATASFAGQHESFLNVRTDDELLWACRACYASLFTDRAIKYRNDHGFDHLKVALSVGVQRMVRSDLASSGVCFTVDPDTGHDQVMLITGSWGLGENVVLGTVNPDEYYVFKPSIGLLNAVLTRKVGDKSMTMIYADTPGEHHTLNIPTLVERRHQLVLSDKEVNQLAGWAQLIERHYGQPMDIEWAKDGLDGEMYIVQARPVTTLADSTLTTITDYQLTQPGTVLCQGNGIGHRIVTGTARVVNSPQDVPADLCPTDILITDITTPDWDPILKRVSAIVTNRGGRTSHAAIVAREIGALAVVGTNTATQVIHEGHHLTVSCVDGQQGVVYAGTLAWTERQTDLAHLPAPHTPCMLILADPAQALRLSQLPCQGVGLFRMEFSISNDIGIHPMALINYPNLPDPDAVWQIYERTHGYADKKAYFVDKLAQSVALVAAAFYPRPVVVRFSDFKTNEYANLLGGKAFEPTEENPMLGWRGASRYYDDRYAEGFRLECEAMRRVRNDLGLTNVKLMIPFCRTVGEGRQVLKQMAKFGLRQHENGLEVYVMAEIPSNVLQAHDFAQLFDGFSIGSNDLTQLTLGVDRDSSTVQGLFSENDPAVRDLIAMLLTSAHLTGTPVGICGQGPSDNPAFAEFLVKAGINSLSFNPDAFLRGVAAVGQAEEHLTEHVAGF